MEQEARPPIDQHNFTPQETVVFEKSDILKPRHPIDMHIFTSLEELKQQTDTTLKEEITNERLKQLRTLPIPSSEEARNNFIDEFNTLTGDSLKGMELSVIHTHGENILIVNIEGKIKQITVTEDNAKEVLKEIKMLDETLKGKSYDLRREILHRSKGSIPTWEAYTYALDIPEEKVKGYVSIPEHWLPERRRLQEKIMEEEVEKSFKLNQKFQEKGLNPKIYLMRGNTASGKTRALKNYERLNFIVGSDGSLSGVINPDQFKTILRRHEKEFGRQEITHYQAHKEGSMLAKVQEDVLLTLGTSIVVDKRLNEVEDIEKYLELARRYDRNIEILDVDASFEASMIGVLARNPEGDDPCVPFDDISIGFTTSRENRSELMDEAERASGKSGFGEITYYVLKVRDKNNQTVEVAKIESGHREVNPDKNDLYLSAIDQVNPTIEAELLRDTVIDDLTIEQITAHYQGDYLKIVRKVLTENKGKTFKEALDFKASQLNMSAPSLDEYVQVAQENLDKTSRTAGGIIDVSASPSKVDQVQTGLSAVEIAQRTKENYRATIEHLYQTKDKDFSSPQELRAFVENVAKGINKNITKKDVLIRDEDSEKYPYMKVENLETAMEQFYEALFEKLNDPQTDPKDLAGWIEYKIDLSEHFFADGCGKTAKAVSSWVLMRAGKSLPRYISREELYKKAPKHDRGENSLIDSVELQVWQDYYRSLFSEDV